MSDSVIVCTVKYTVVSVPLEKNMNVEFIHKSKNMKSVSIS